jgi:hypothetical protein
MPLTEDVQLALAACTESACEAWTGTNCTVVLSPVVLEPGMVIGRPCRFFDVSFNRLIRAIMSCLSSLSVDSSGDDAGWPIQCMLLL